MQCWYCDVQKSYKMLSQGIPLRVPDIMYLFVFFLEYGSSGFFFPIISEKQLFFVFFILGSL